MLIQPALIYVLSLETLIFVLPSYKKDDDLDGWNTSSVTSMRSMFEGCVDMNGYIEELDVSNVEDMSLMVGACVIFPFSCSASRN